MYVHTIQQTDKQTPADFDKAATLFLSSRAVAGEAISNVTFLTAGEKLTAVYLVMTNEDIQRQRFLQQQH